MAPAILQHWVVCQVEEPLALGPVGSGLERPKDSDGEDIQHRRAVVDHHKLVDNLGANI